MLPNNQSAFHSAALHLQSSVTFLLRLLGFTHILGIRDCIVEYSVFNFVFVFLRGGLFLIFLVLNVAESCSILPSVFMRFQFKNETNCSLPLF